MGDRQNSLKRRRDYGTLKRLCGLTAVVLFCLLWVTMAAAYIIPGPFVIELMTRNLAAAQSLYVEQQVTIDDPAVSDDPVELSEQLRFLLPGRFRSEILHQDSRRILVVSQEESLTIVDDHVVPGGEGRFDRYKDLLLFPSRDMMHKALLSRGVDVGIVSLGRLQDHLVYVIGAQYPDESVSQLWVDKVRLLPLRWINVFPAGQKAGQNDRLDFLYKDWRNVDGTWYPMRIESLLNQRPIRTINATHVEANKVIDGELMNIAHLVSLYAAPQKPPPQAEHPADAVDEVEQTIEDFKKKFEP